MFQSVTLARPYSQAVFDFAVEQGQLEYWQQILTILAKIIVHPNVKTLISGYFSERKIEDIFNIISGNQLNVFAKNLIKIMVSNKRLSILPDVLKEFIRLRYSYKKIVKIYVISANNLTTLQMKKIAMAMEKRLSRKVQIVYKIDKLLISGLIIRIGDVVIDNSVRSCLERFKNTLQI